MQPAELCGHEPAERYDGPARIGATEVEVRLRGGFQPIDGLLHWWGRIGSNPSLDAYTSGSRVTIETPHGTAEGRLSDVDPWGVSGSPGAASRRSEPVDVTLHR